MTATAPMSTKDRPTGATGATGSGPKAATPTQWPADPPASADGNGNPVADPAEDATVVERAPENPPVSGDAHGDEVHGGTGATGDTGPAGRARDDHPRDHGAHGHRR